MKLRGPENGEGHASGADDLLRGELVFGHENGTWSIPDDRHEDQLPDGCATGGLQQPPRAADVDRGRLPWIAGRVHDCVASAHRLVYALTRRQVRLHPLFTPGVSRCRGSADRADRDPAGLSGDEHFAPENTARSCHEKLHAGYLPSPAAGRDSPMARRSQELSR